MAHLKPSWLLPMRASRSLSRPVSRPLGRLLTRRLDGRRWRRPDRLAEICALVGRYLRMRRRAAAAEPHIFGRHAAAYYADTLREEKFQAEVEAALLKVYGPPPPDSPPPRSVWSERYAIPPGQEKFHRRWFREKYGPE